MTTTSQAAPDRPLDPETRAIELADEFGMNAVLVRLRGVEASPPLLAEAVLEVTELLVRGDWPLWHVEQCDDFAVLVADGAPRSMKRALVELEGSHEMGEWWNLDLVTQMDAGPRPWHGGPEREIPRPAPVPLDADRLEGYDWSPQNPHVSTANG